jgi:probable phosphoglycerate mutase
MGELLLVRHGQTEWSLSGRHTGLTDLPLTAHGEAQASVLRRALADRAYALVLSSPLQRAHRTAELAGLSAQVEPDLVEWDYGAYEGVTTPDIQADRPGWDLFEDGAPDGESVADVEARCRRVLQRVLPALEDGDVLVVGHGHALRSLGAVWAGLPVAAGGALVLDPASTSTLGTHHGRPVIRAWNVAVTG